jgi:hypothetical protein
MASSLLVSFIIIHFPVLENEELPSLLAHNLLPNILDTIKH